MELYVVVLKNRSSVLFSIDELHYHEGGDGIREVLQETGDGLEDGSLQYARIHVIHDILMF